MLHISSEGLIHRDLAARNVLLGSSLEPKISGNAHNLLLEITSNHIDFGMSRAVESAEMGGKTESGVGPLKWMVRKISKKFSKKS